MDALTEFLINKAGFLITFLLGVDLLTLVAGVMAIKRLEKLIDKKIDQETHDINARARHDELMLRMENLNQSFVSEIKDLKLELAKEEKRKLEEKIKELKERQTT